MVVEASLRLRIDATAAKAAADETRRSLDALAASADRLGGAENRVARETKQLDYSLDALNADLKRIEANTAATAQGILRMEAAMDRLGQRRAVDVTHTERQITSGRKLSLIFGELVSKTAKTGGAFLAVDFLARVAGFNSLLDLMNTGLNKAAAAVREFIVGQDSFFDLVNKSAKEATLSLDEYLAKLAQVSSASSIAGGQRVGLPGGGLATIGAGVSDNPYFAQKIAEAIEEYQRQLAQEDARQRRENNIALRSRRPAREFASTAEADLKSRLEGINAEYLLLQRNLKAWAAEDAKEMPAATKRAEDWLKALARGASLLARGRFEAFGAALVSPAALAGVQAGQRYAQMQGYAQSPPDRGLFGPPPSTDQAGGNFFMQNIVAAGAGAARYAANLSTIIERQKEAQRTAEAFGSSAAQAFEDAVFNARSFEEGLEMIARSLTRVIFNQLVTQQLAGAIAGLFPTASAKGNVFSAGSVVPFSKGGVVTGPVVFPMAGGKSGLMGEDEPEAIMPLGRNSKGELGVKGGGGVTVNMTVVTQDAASFRRSRRQIQDDLRGVARGVS